MKLHRKIVLISKGKLPNCASAFLATLSNSLAVKGIATDKKGKKSQEYKKSVHQQSVLCSAYDLVKCYPTISESLKKSSDNIFKYT